MCELLGMTAIKDMDVTDCLETFFSHSDINPHGWGMMYYKDGSTHIVKEPKKALDSRILPPLMKALPR
ncbi:MAG: class II glutamine amidotransferase, partial [Oscillospiraceae bacterium]|nr:class II glutamine amidotransferase [Oscillospiraceae bacterium]